MNVAKMQSEREYKKGYEASKTRYHTPLDMFSVTAAKKSQEVATNTNYRQPFHNYTLLPDAMNVEHSKNAMQIQSDVCNNQQIVGIELFISSWQEEGRTRNRQFYSLHRKPG